MQEPFNFDEWKNIHETDLAEFQFRRKLVIDEVIANAPPERQKSLRNLQDRLDAIHITCTPEQGMKKMFDMMVDRVDILMQLCQNVKGLANVEGSKQGA